MGGQLPRCLPFRLTSSPLSASLFLSVGPRPYIHIHMCLHWWMVEPGDGANGLCTQCHALFSLGYGEQGATFLSLLAFGDGVYTPFLLSLFFSSVPVRVACEQRGAYCWFADPLCPVLSTSLGDASLRLRITPSCDSLVSSVFCVVAFLVSVRRMVEAEVPSVALVSPHQQRELFFSSSQLSALPIFEALGDQTASIYPHSLVAGYLSFCPVAVS